MVDISSDLCYGCGACQAICPSNTIVMQMETGFLRPKVVNEKCVNCNLCQQVCPIDNHVLNGQTDELYIYKNTDIIREASTSGGAFSALCEFILHRKGTIYGALFDNNFYVKHVRGETEHVIELMHGSKYLQSNMTDVFLNVKNDLKIGMPVLFSGTPCQNAALRNYLEISRVSLENLILCDFICHGVPSPQIWRDYLDFLEMKVKSKTKSVNFRSKENGWNSQELRIEFENGSILSLNEEKSPYYQLFYSNCMLRKSCHHCAFSSSSRISDFTIADAWGVEKSFPSYDDNKGVSLILVNTDKARDILNELEPNECLKSISFSDIAQPHLSKPAKSSPKRDLFWNEYSRKGFKYILNKYGNYSIYRKLIKKTKRTIIKVLVLCHVRKN